MKFVSTYSELRQQIHDDLRRRHPEWVQPNGESPKCDSYVYDEAGNVIETRGTLASSKSGDALRSARLALIPCWRHTTFVRSGRSGRPRETKGVTVTVPLLTGREIRALKRPEASSV